MGHAVSHVPTRRPIEGASSLYCSTSIPHCACRYSSLIDGALSRRSLSSVSLAASSGHRDVAVLISNNGSELVRDDRSVTVVENFQYASSDGCWKVRPIVRDNKDEVRRVVQLQTDSFHVPNPLPIIDATSKRFFNAEVLSEMQKKLKYNSTDDFLCLVIEPTNTAKLFDGKSREPSTSGSVVCGVIEVSLLAEKEVLDALKSFNANVEIFSYISSMCVDPPCRRKGAASALLQAAEKKTKLWRQDQAVLHVYQDNEGAIALYSRAGYEIIQQDASWYSMLGMRPRYLMRKRLK